MNEEIAHASIGVDVDDAGVAAALRRIETEYQRAMQKIDNMDAEATVDANILPLQKKLKQAEKDLRAFKDSKREQIPVEELLVRKAKEQVDLAKEKLAAQKKENAELNKAQGILDAVAKRQAAREKVLADAERRRLTAAKAEQKEVERLARIKQQAAARQLADQRREEAMRERIATKAALEERRRQVAAEKTLRDAAKLQVAREKEIAQIPTMRRQYVELGNTIDKLAASRRKMHGERAKILVDLKVAEATAKMVALKEALQRLGENPPVEIDVKPGHQFGEAVYHAFKNRRFDHESMLAGLRSGEAFSGGFHKSLLGRGIGGLGSIGSAISRGLSNVSEATVRLGPFTTSIRGLFIGLAVLGPVLVDVIGALGALVGVVGSAALGVGALSAGLIGGAIPAFLGMGLVVKDVVQEFTAAKKATKAYDDAVTKHGKSSDQAAKKLEELKNVMGSVTDETAKNFVEGQKLGKEWDKLTAPAHRAVWTAIGEGLKTAGALLPMFARNTNESMGIAERGTTKWQKALRSPEGQRVLDTMMKNFSKTLGPVLNGLGSIVGYIGKVGAEASRYLPGIGNTFEHWAKGLNDSADGSSKFKNKIREIVQSAKDVGNLFLAAGRFVKTFFGGGVDAGQKFTHVMTDALNRWTAFLQTTEGKKSLRSYFNEAVDGARTLWNALVPIAGTFARWAILIAPAVRLLLEGAAAVSKVVAGFLRLTGLNGPLSALVTTLGVLWGIGKISAATRAVGGFTAALLGLSRANKAVAVSQVGAGLTSGIMGGAGAVGAAKTAANMGKVAKVGAVTTNVLRGLGAATIGVGGAWGGAAVLAGGLAYGIYKLSTRTRQWEKDAKASTAALQESVAALNEMQSAAIAVEQTDIDLENSHRSLKDATSLSAKEEKKLAALRAAGKKDTQEYSTLNTQHRQTLLDLRQARLNDEAAIKSHSDAEKHDKQNRKESVDAARKTLIDANKSIADLGKQQTGGGLFGGGKSTKEAFEGIASAAAKAGKSVSEFIKTGDLRKAGITDPIQLKRVLQYAEGLKRVAAAQLQLNRATFAAAFKGTGDPKAVGASAAKTAASGTPRSLIFKIIADSRSADEAIRRLQNARIDTKRLDVIQRGGPAAIAMLQRITGTKLTPKQQAIAQRGGPGVLGLLRTILGLKLSKKDQRVFDAGGAKTLGILQRLAAQVLPPKTQVTTLITQRKIVDVGTNLTNKARPKSGPGAATGRGNRGGASYTALVGEGRAEEWHWDDKLGTMTKTRGPEFRRLGSNDAIIPTEPRYRSRGREIFRQVAEDLGIPMHRTGKKKADPPLSTRGAMQARGLARHNIHTKARPTVNSSGLQAMQDVETAKQNEANWSRQIGIWEGQLKEPSTFLQVVGNDPETGDPLYAIDQAKVDAWAQQLTNIANSYDALLVKIQTVEDTVVKAMRRIGNPDTKTGGIIGKTYANAGVLLKLMDREDGIMGRKGPSKAEKQAAAQRKGIYKEALAGEQDTRNKATTDYRGLETDQNDLFFRRQEATNNRNEYREDAAAVQGKAETQATEAAPKVDPFAAGNRRVNALNAESALAAIGQGLMGGSARSQSAIDQDSIAANQNIINTARGLLSDNDPSNDSDALSAIQNAASAISGINDSIKSGAGSTSSDFGGTSFKNLAAARGFGNNFTLAAAMGAAAQVTAPGVGGSGAYGMNPSSPYASQSGAPGGIVFNQTFLQPPDPHTFSQGVAFELKAAL